MLVLRPTLQGDAQLSCLSHVSHMAATKVFRTEILEPLFAESDDGKVSADDLLNMDKNTDASLAVCQVRDMFFLSSSVRTLVGFQ